VIAIIYKPMGKYKTKWQQVYVGPFSKKEADKMVAGIKKVANPAVNAIHDAKTRKRPKKNLYDVYIKMTDMKAYPGLSTSEATQKPDRSV